MEKLRTYSGKNVKPDKARPYANHHQFLIIGGGTAGITAASQLKKKLNKPDIAVIEPSDVHYYQPMWTFNGAGVFHKEKSKKLMKDIMPDDVAWIKDYVVAFHPEQNIVETECGMFYSYEYLVVAPGNLVSLLENGKIDENLFYDGYGSCPLITGYNRLILAEFDYNNNMTPSFPFNQAKERRSMYHMKRDLLPMVYWQGMLKGRA